MAMTVAQLVARVSVEGDDEAKRKLASMGEAVSHTSGGFKSMLANALSFATGMGMFNLAADALGFVKDKFTDLIKAGIDSNAALEQMRVSFNAFTNDARKTDSVLRQLQSFAAKTPFQLPGIEQASLKLLNMGVASQDLTKYLSKIGDAVAKVGGNDAMLNEVATILSQMSMKGKVTTEEMLQLTERNIPAFQLLADAMHVPVSTLQTMITNGELGKDKIDLLVASMGKFGNGAMQKQGATFNGLLSTLQDNATQALQVFSGPLFEMAKSNLDKLGQLVSSKQFQDFAKEWGTKIGSALQQAGDFIQNNVIPAFQNLADWGGKIGQAFQSQQFQSLIQSAQDLAGTLNDILLPKLQPVKDGLTGIFSDAGATTGATNLANAFQFMAGVLNGLNAGVQGARDIWQSLQPVFQQIGAFLISQFGPIFQQIGDTIQSQLVPAWNQLVTALQPAMPLLQGIGAVLAGVLIGVLGIVIATVVGLAQAVAGAIPGIIQAISGIIQVFTGLVQFFTGIVQFIYDLFTGNFGKLGADLGLIWQGIVNQVMGLVNIVVGLFNSMVGMVSGFISGFVSSIIGFFTHLWDVLVGHSIVPDMINSIVSWFAGLPGRAIAFVSRLVSMAIGFFSSLASQAVSKATQLVSGFVGKIAQLPGQAGAKAQEVVSTITSKLSGLAGAAAAWGSSLIQAFINGMASMIGAVGQKAGEIMQKAKDFLAPGSPTKEGPGRSLMTWGPNLIKHYAEGMLSQIPALSEAANKAAMAAMSPLSRSGEFGSLSTGYLPVGAQYITPMQASSTPTQIIVQPPAIYLDGRMLSNGLMPYIADNIRYGVGSTGF